MKCINRKKNYYTKDLEKRFLKFFGWKSALVVEFMTNFTLHEYRILYNTECPFGETVEHIKIDFLKQEKKL